MDTIYRPGTRAIDPTSGHIIMEFRSEEQRSAFEGIMVLHTIGEDSEEYDIRPNMTTSEKYIMRYTDGDRWVLHYHIDGNALGSDLGSYNEEDIEWEVFNFLEIVLHGSGIDVDIIYVDAIGRGHESQMISSARSFIAGSFDIHIGTPVKIVRTITY